MGRTRRAPDDNSHTEESKLIRRPCAGADERTTRGAGEGREQWRIGHHSSAADASPARIRGRVMSGDSPWMSGDAASEYLSGGERTETGRHRFSRHFLAKQVAKGKLRAARVGGRGQLLYRREWLDAWLEEHAQPVIVAPVRRRA
jgi:hypothetical protein